MQARWGTHGDHPIIALCPRGVRETFDLTVRAFNLTEIYRTPVILLLDEIVGHVNEKVVLPERVTVLERAQPEVPPESYLPYAHTDDRHARRWPPSARGYRFHVTGLVHDETGFPTNDPAEIDGLLRRLDRKIERYARRSSRSTSSSCPGAKIGVFAYGSTRAFGPAGGAHGPRGGDPGRLPAPRSPSGPSLRSQVRADGRAGRPHPRAGDEPRADGPRGGVGGGAPGPRCNRLTRVDGEPIRPHRCWTRSARSRLASEVKLPCRR